MSPRSSHAGEPLRRRPAQRRSVRRVERMLDACAELLDEGGYDALTTTRVAERAGVAIGSVYQFFPDKRALSQALARRNAELFAARVGRRFMIEDYTGWWDAVDAIIDEYVEMHRSVPGFRSLHFGDVFDLDLLDSVADNSTVIAGRLRALLLTEFGLADGEDLDRAILVAVEAGDAVLKLAFRHDPHGDPVIVTEAKQLVRGYLSRQLAAAESRRR
ncbi:MULTISPECIES: TetR family transcriptional regulator [Microbispora]|uniref:TetR/AcrR family transcriptional regulator n=3 Tax=Microbispora TaxID=2005 RepID=A0ABY3M6G5_9ACTN|nr:MULTISPECIES: TetR family transcriptional regulator [Microbispora]GLW23705.1 TetR family transcriptional regulator [Microbispora amethystogenes]MBO4273732.1 TetR family transcriptional regulator [Microbispora triticiradicis]RGA01783.1 TetR/AcrR family transcriptional regulator [Microbispora triticiradicis]TLP66852.1 TetR/AcrR family transcriptional regulator [Microbispora fusca]TYB68302.1 TetR/AcrR family transcriptional regulator [Microbispora tritici]